MIAVQPLRTDTFSCKQELAFNIVDSHCFGSSQQKQLLMVVISMAGTGKSFLISSIHSLFAEWGCSGEIKITTPTGIAAANILGSTLFSLLSLHHTILTGQCLVVLQSLMRAVHLLIIDEYSFMSASVFDSLDRHLRLIFPLSDRPFGRLNIVLCGDPAQLPCTCIEGTLHISQLSSIYSRQWSNSTKLSNRSVTMQPKPTSVPS